MPEFMPISLRIGPLTIARVAKDVVELERPVIPLASAARMTGRYSGRAPAMTALTATFSTVNSQNSRNAVGRRRPTTSSRARLVPASMASTRSSVGSTIGRKSVQRSATKSCWRFSSVSGSSSGWGGAIEGQAGEVLVVERLGEPFDDELHERPAVDGILAVDVGAQLAVGAPDDRLGDEDLARRRHAVGARHRPREAGEDVRVHGDRRDPVVALQRRREPDDRRATGASKTHRQDGGVPVGLDRRAHVGVVDPALARLRCA